MLRSFVSKFFLFSLFALSAPAILGAELITNGGFETGDFTGWTTANAPAPWRSWQVSTSGLGGGYSPVPTTTSVWSGARNAWNGVAADPGSFLLYQDVSIPSGVSAQFTWNDRFQMNHTSFCSVCGTATYAVEILNTSNVLLQTVYIVNALSGSNVNTGFVNHSVDLSAYGGQTVRIRFRTTVTVSYAGPGQVEIDAVSVQTIAPTAAPVSITGRLFTADGRAVSRASVTITDQYGVSRSVTASSFGYYRFDDVRAGETYIIGVSHRQYRFPGSPAAVNVGDEITGLNFIAAR